MAHHSTKFCGIASHLTNDLGCCCGGDSLISFNDCTVYWKCDSTVVRCEVRRRGTNQQPVNVVMSTQLEGDIFIGTNQWGGTWELWVSCSQRGRMTLASSAFAIGYDECPSCCSEKPNAPRSVSFEIFQPSDEPTGLYGWSRDALSRYSGTYIVSPNSSGCAGYLSIDNELPTLFELCQSLGSHCENRGVLGDAYLWINGLPSGELVRTVNFPESNLNHPPYYRPPYTARYYWELRSISIGWSVGNDQSFFPFSAHASIEIGIRQYVVPDPPFYTLSNGLSLTATVDDFGFILSTGRQGGCQFKDLQSYASGNIPGVTYLTTGTKISLTYI